MEGHFPYLTSEYARQKMIEGYDIEMRERERKEALGECRHEPASNYPRHCHKCGKVIPRDKQTGNIIRDADHAEIHRECDEYRVAHGQEPVNAEELALQTITEINERYKKINKVEEK